MTAAEGYVEMPCYASLSVPLLDVLCFRSSIFPLFNGLRVLIGKAKTHKNFRVLGKTMASYAMVEKC